MAEETNVDKDVIAYAKVRNEMEIDLKEERKTQAYKEKMNIDIENINIFERRNKVYTTQCRRIYEFLESGFFLKSESFPDDSMKQCKDNTNEARNILVEVKIT